MELKDAGRDISNRLAAYKQELRSMKVAITEDIEKTTVDLKEAAALGDLRENAEFTAAVEKLSQLNARLNNLLEQLKDIEDIDGEENYENIGMIVLFSTVKVRLKETGEVFIFKLYPGNVSKVEEGIVSVESPVGKNIWFKVKGSVFTVEHAVTGEPIEFEIEDFY